MPHQHSHPSALDLVIIGGGPAGMSAALIAGRAMLDTVIVNAESPRNAVTTASHGLLTRDGAHPTELLAVAKFQPHPERSAMRQFDVNQFHADFDRHPDDRVRLFQTIAGVVAPSTRVLYPGSYVDIAPSVWFDDVTYVDTDKRAARFFAETEALGELIVAKRRANHALPGPPTFAFHHLDYREPLPVEPGSVGMLVSLYAGFISEHCTDLLATGGTLLVNPSHGDAAMASIDPRYELSGVVTSRDGIYRVGTIDLDTYLQPNKPQAITLDSLHESGRGVGYTRSPFAYLFTKVR